jgi:hypothetical protein
MAMSDSRLYQIARRKDEAAQREKDGKREKDDLNAKLVGELQRRRTKSMERPGVKVTLVEPEETKYDWDVLASLLTPRILRSIQVEAVDKEKLAEAVQAGRIDTALLAQATTVTQKSAYVNVSIRNPD